jgi:hypothetical protein
VAPPGFGKALVSATKTYSKTTGYATPASP